MYHLFTGSFHNSPLYCFTIHHDFPLCLQCLGPNHGIIMYCVAIFPKGENYFLYFVFLPSGM